MISVRERFVRFVDASGNLYTAEVGGGRPQKFVPRPGADPAVLIGQPVRGVATTTSSQN